MSTPSQDLTPPEDVSHAATAQGAQAAESPGVNARLRSRLDLIALVVVAAGFAIRATIAAAGYLNPDEAVHYLLANQPSVTLAYKASLTNAHPPLFFLLLYFWRFLGTSELTLRLPSLLAGTAMLWVAFRWLGYVFGMTAGLIGLLLLTFSPAMIRLSAEVRGYAVLLLFMASALYWLERAFEEQSAGMMRRFSFALYLAILTHYAALLFALALGVYALLRIIGRQLPPGVLTVWVGSQAGAMALYAFLYVTHIATLKGGGMEQEAITGWLRTSYFHPGQDSLLLFPLTQSAAVFGYLFSQRAAGIPMLLVFLGGVACLLARAASGGLHRPNRREVGILLLLPFIFGCGAAILGVYPYGGTRHSVYLSLFAVAGASVSLGQLAGRKLWPVLLAAMLVAPVWNLKATPPPQFIHPYNQGRTLMNKAVTYIRRSIPPGAILFVDLQTSRMFGYYLGKDQMIRIGEPQSQQDFFEYPYGGYRVVSSKRWDFNAASFKNELGRMRAAYGAKPGEMVWVVDAGWGVNLYTELTRRFPELYLPGLMFGDNIAVFQVPLAQGI